MSSSELTSDTDGFTGVVGLPDTRAVLATFGQPARTEHDGQYTIYIWNKNLLTDLWSHGHARTPPPGQ